MSYEDNVKIWKDAYTEILEVCEKYPNFDQRFSFYDIQEMRNKAKNHLMLIDWYEKYGLKLDHSHHTVFGYNYFRVSEYTSFQKFGDAAAEKEAGSGRYIAWSVDDRQPDHEWLFIINFPTGAYIFGGDYPTDLFQRMWEELKAFGPKYRDDVNKYLYFSMEDAAPIMEQFNGIMQKYRQIYKDEETKREIEATEAKLKKLKEKENG